MRIVPDTNVVVSALIWGGTPFRLIQAASAGDIELYTSPVLLAELREVLSRAHLAERLTEQRSSVEEAVGLYGELAIRLSPLETPRVVPGDADDDHVIALAVAARAHLIVSGDKAHLIPLGSVGGIPIVSPAQAVHLLQPA